MAYITIAAALAFFAAFLAWAAWLVGTTAGAKRLLDMASQQTGVNISEQKIEGNLAGSLRLENMILQWPQGMVRIEDVQLDARPRDLIMGRIGIERLKLSRLSIQDDAPDKAPRLVWPKASGLVAWIGGKVHRLDIRDITYRRLEKEPLHIRTITAALTWQNAHLTLGDLRLVSDAGEVEGSVLASFIYPTLKLDGATRLSKPLAGAENIRFAANLRPGKEKGELAGNLLFSGSRQNQPIWELSGDAGMTAAGFPLKNVRVQRPGQAGLVTAEGLITFRGPEPYLTLKAQATRIDLASSLNVATNLSGTLTFAGSGKAYRGRITLVNKSDNWQSAGLAGDYSGNADGVTFTDIQGTALGGRLSGLLTLDWRQGLAVNGVLQGRNLDPAGFDPDWAGRINFDLTGAVSSVKSGPPSGKVTCTLGQSRLHGQQLTGNLSAAFAGDDIKIQHLALQGRGFDISAAGAVKNKVDFTARISDLSRLVPRASGKLSAKGFLRRLGGRVSGSVSAEAGGLKAFGLEIADAGLAATLEDTEHSPLSVNAMFTKPSYRGFAADTLSVTASGTKAAHAIGARLRRGRYEMQLNAAGAWQQGGWQGKLLSLEGTDGVGPWKLAGPAGLSVTSKSLSIQPLILSGRAPETVGLSGNLEFQPLGGSLRMDWQALNLARASSWTSREHLLGTTSGHVQIRFLPQNHLELTGKGSLAGTFQSQGQTVGIRQSEFSIQADGQGVRAGLDIRLAQGGMLQGTFTADGPARLALPETGNLNLNWRDFDMAPVSSWLPGLVQLEGKMDGEARGRLLPEGRFALSGRAALAQSKIHCRVNKGDLLVHLQNAVLDFVWQDSALSGTLRMTMADYGKLQGRFRLPVAARWPLSVDDRGKIQATLEGKVQEKGALGMLFPGLIQESHGDLDLNLTLDGSPAEPLFEGVFRLSKAGAYLPTAGIFLKDARIDARLAQDVIYVDAFRASAGPGYIEGAARIRLHKWRMAAFEGQLRGERFQTIFFPELQVQSSPKLTFTGTPQKISVRGEVHLPDIRIIGAQSRRSVEASPDVIRAGKTRPAAAKFPVDLDVQVKMILGDSVWFRASGIDAQLGGQLDLQFEDPQKITSRGEIRVVRGNFRTYGVNLNIVRGRLFYAGGPIQQPALDILAWRKVGDVHAGVLVSGTLGHPVIKLYSEPFMQDMDILAYIVLGHPLGSSSEQASLMAMAANALLTSRQSEALQYQIKKRLGIDTLNITTDVVTSNGYMGYKRINITPTGAGTDTTGSVSDTMLVVGKYLTPQLYISYGRSLFSGGNLFFLRYDVSKNWQIETQTGKESGVDIYYKIELK